jgi:hypothetical protein
MILSILHIFNILSSSLSAINIFHFKLIISCFNLSNCNCCIKLQIISVSSCVQVDIGIVYFHGLLDDICLEMNNEVGVRSIDSSSISVSISVSIFVSISSICFFCCNILED